jgi:TolA-binding protein
MKRHAAHWTRWLQWALVVSVAVGVGVIAFAVIGGKRADTLYITLGELRSNAAELREIARAASAERVTPTFARAQGRQLEQRIASLQGDLEKARRERRSNDVAAALALADRLRTSSRALVARADSPPAARALEPEFETIVAALIPLERQARP